MTLSAELPKSHVCLPTGFSKLIVHFLVPTLVCIKHPIFRKGTGSIRGSGNLRITFRFEAADAHDLDLEDYH